MFCLSYFSVQIDCCVSCVRVCISVRVSSPELNQTLLSCEPERKHRAPLWTLTHTHTHTHTHRSPHGTQLWPGNVPLGKTSVTHVTLPIKDTLCPISPPRSSSLHPPSIFCLSLLYSETLRVVLFPSYLSHLAPSLSFSLLPHSPQLLSPSNPLSISPPCPTQRQLEISWVVWRKPSVLSRLFIQSVAMPEINKEACVCDPKHLSCLLPITHTPSTHSHSRLCRAPSLCFISW